MAENELKQDNANKNGGTRKRRLTDKKILEKLLKEGTDEQKKTLKAMIQAYRDRKTLQQKTNDFDKILSELEATKKLLLNNGYSESDIAKLMEDARNKKIVNEEKTSE